MECACRSVGLLTDCAGEWAWQNLIRMLSTAFAGTVEIWELEHNLQFGDERYTGFLLQGTFAGSVELTTAYLKLTLVRAAA
jgi:hypothetical protein